METITREGIKISDIFNSIENFKRGVNLILLQRQYFQNKVLPILREGKNGQNGDYYVIKGKKVLSKGGAERICQIFQLTASFEKDSETLASFTNAKDIVAFKCTLRRPDGSIAGEGRGCASLAKNGGSENSTIKMAAKSSLIDSVIHSSHISNLFTQDLDDMPEFREQVVPTDREIEPVKTDGPLMATPRQLSYLKELIHSGISDEDQREDALNSLETISRYEASEMISSFVGTR